MNRTGLRYERAVALFILALLAFNPPLLTIFTAPVRLFGIPVLYIYLFCAWGGVILLVALVTRGKKAGVQEPPLGEGRKDQDNGH